MKNAPFIAALLSCLQPNVGVSKTSKNRDFDIHAHLLADKSRGQIPENSVKGLAEELAAKIVALLLTEENILNQGGSTPLCENSTALTARLHALVRLGKNTECLAEISMCAEKLTSPSPAYLEASFQAAICADANDKIALAAQLYEVASKPDATSSEGHRPKAFAYALFLARMNPAGLDALLAGPSGWEEAARAQVRGAVELLVSGDTLACPRASGEKFITNALTNDSVLWFETLAGEWLMYLVRDRQRYQDALALMSDKLDKMHIALPDILGPAFVALYRFEGLDVAQIFYETLEPILARLHWLPAVNKQVGYSWLPVEHNVQTYDELRQGDCRSSFAKGEQLITLTAAKNKWKSGQATPEDLEKMFGSEPTTDELTLIGDAYFFRKDLVAAETNYWRAHVLCKFNNRAHWGLTIARNWRRLQARPSAAQRLVNLRKIVAELNYPPSFQSYVKDWQTIPPTVMLGLKFSMKFFVGHIDFLTKNARNLVVKFPHQYMSDVPGYEDMRNQRVEYKNDNRLWDDVRGNGGPTVVVDAAEIEAVPFGAFNLAGHEVAHQWHLALNPHSAVKTCIDSLFIDAQRRNVFVSAYAATNVLEYFAEGVRIMGIETTDTMEANRQWLVSNDPALFQLLSKIESSQGPPTEVSCGGFAAK